LVEDAVNMAKEGKTREEIVGHLEAKNLLTKVKANFYNLLNF
jgi:hypothetical protein